jgi:hypothetical protein
MWYSSRMYIRVQYIQGIFQSRLSTADYALVTSNLHNNDSLVTWTVIRMTAAKFKPLIFSESGSALSNVGNSLILMILDDFCLLPAWFCYAIIKVWLYPIILPAYNISTRTAQKIHLLTINPSIVAFVSQQKCRRAGEDRQFFQGRLPEMLLTDVGLSSLKLFCCSH